MRVFYFLLFTITISYSQGIEGRYDGAVNREGSIQVVSFNFFLDSGNQKATYEIPECGLYDVPVENISIDNEDISFKFYYGDFDAKLKDNNKSILGLSVKWNPKIKIHLKKATPIKKTYLSESIKFKNEDIELCGTLYIPDSKKHPNPKYVVLVHGSGNQDRNTYYYISFAHKLADNGIGVLFYDKRGTGKSKGVLAGASLSILAKDANSALSYLKTRKDLNIERIGLLGTSQGGWISTIAQSEKELADFLILNVGPAVSVYEQDLHRIKYSMKIDEWKQKSIDSALAYARTYFNYAEKPTKKNWKILTRQITNVQNKNWKGYIKIPKSPESMNWFISNNYNPKNDLENLQIPVLSILGEIDPLVPPKENEANMKSYLKKANVNYKVVVIPDSPHDMITYAKFIGEDWQWPNSYWKWKKQDSKFMDVIVDFLKHI
ncbi:alpha/beta hydrolase family protein [Winogradskyella luteola]|uniref:Alpha/beta hydrolase n=1 Tax=Winogradskyella luteola TaxID=2828330 RepID=A0A9X1F7K3_9FLAO|nr:alpha/beta hydrolase [Winogradskyella luteola]MBV7268699.1 alpha/beta hydrolase [Winogradskyella luteola]